MVALIVGANAKEGINSKLRQSVLQFVHVKVLHRLLILDVLPAWHYYKRFLSHTVLQGHQ